MADARGGNRQRLLELFRAEAAERLAALTAGALRIERAEATPELIAALARSAHTIKGGAAMLGLDDVVSRAEPLEQTFRSLRSDPGGDVELNLIDAIDELAAAIWPQTAVATPTPGVTPPPADGPPKATLRISADRLDSLLALVADARRAARRLARSDETWRLQETLGAAEAAALRLRLVPLGAVFGELERTIRDLGLEHGKQIELVTRGGDVEADAALVDVAAEVLLQLARNAVAHGIESPEERRAHGKPSAGRISIDLRTRGGWLEVRVADDGRGIDEAAVRARAAGLGLDQSLTVAELLFLPGVSTREAVDALGGLGVGLEIVRERVQSVAGELTVSWTQGNGTQFVARMPVSALFERLLTGSLDGALVGVPIEAVAAVVEAGETESPDGQRILLEGEVDERSVLTFPLGGLFDGSRLFRRAWIAEDGLVGLVLEVEGLVSD